MCKSHPLFTAALLPPKRGTTVAEAFHRKEGMTEGVLDPLMTGEVSAHREGTPRNPAAPQTSPRHPKSCPGDARKLQNLNFSLVFYDVSWPRRRQETTKP